MCADLASARRAPRRIDQLIPAIIEHDAVSNHTFEAQRLLREMGFRSEIYASIIGPGAEGRARPMAELPEERDGSQWLLYQCSIGSPVADRFASHPGTKLLDYHNITPADLVERWIPPLGAESRLGRAQLATLAPLVRWCFADSAYNAAELASLGYVEPIVVPVLVESANVTARPDERVLAALRQGEQRSTWLFVGQVAPHKAQHDIVRAFACYRSVFDPTARLFMVGREMGRAYRDAVGGLVSSIGLTDAVQLTGSVPTETLAAYYEVADVFVCLSDHEGFSVPIVEAMARGVPVVAYAAAAVPGTVGSAGILLRSKTPEVVASAVDVLLTRPELRAQLMAAGRAQAARLTLSVAQERFRQAIETAVASA